MLVKIEAPFLIFPVTDFHFPSTSVPPGTFLGTGRRSAHEVNGPSRTAWFCWCRTRAVHAIKTGGGVEDAMCASVVLETLFGQSYAF